MINYQDTQGFLSEKKTYEWAKHWFDKIISNAASYIAYTDIIYNEGINDYNYIKQKLYKYYLFHGSDTFFANAFKHINTKVFNVVDSETNTKRSVEYVYPTPIRNINNIKPIILQLYGEQIARPFNFSVQNISKNAVAAREEAFMNLYLKKKNLELKQQLIQAGIPFTNQQEIEQEFAKMPTDIEEYLRMSYKDKYASAMQSLLDYYYYRYNIKEQTDNAFLDLCIFNEEIYLINLKNSQYKIQKINPLNCVYDTQYSNIESQDPSWFVMWDFLDLNECISRFHLTDAQVLELERQNSERHYFDHQNIFDATVYSQYNSNFLSEKFLVYYGMWKAIAGLEAIKADNFYYIKDLDEYHKKEFNRLMKDPKYRKRKETLHFQQLWEGIRIGANVYVGLHPMQEQPRSSENLKSTKLPVSITKLEGRSLVDDMKNIDFLLKILWHKVEYLLSQAKGNVLVYDLSYIPRQYNYDLDKVIYHLNTEGLLLYNSKEDGMVNNGGNMIHSYDLGISQTLSMVIQLIQIMESKLEDIAGVNKQRMAQMSGKDNLGVTKAALQQSILRTEYLYRVHSVAVKNLLTTLCDFLKEYYANSDEPIQFLYNKIGATEATIINLLPENLMSDFAIFINDVTKETEVFNSIRMLSQMFIQQGMLDVQAYINILESENLQIAKAKLQLYEEAKKAEAQQNANAEREAEQQLLKLKQDHELRLVQENAKINKEMAEIQERSEMSIQIEKLKAEQEKLKLEAERIQTEREKLNATIEMEMQKFMADTKNKEKELDSKITLEQLKQNTELQKMQLQAKIDKVLKELDINAKKELELSKLQFEYEMKKMEAQKILHTQQAENYKQNNIQTQNLITQQQELQLRQKEFESKIKELEAIKQRVLDYENRLQAEAKAMQEYIKQLDTKALHLEKELEDLRKEKIKIEKEKIKIETKQPNVGDIGENLDNDTFVSLEDLGIE